MTCFWTGLVEGLLSKKLIPRGMQPMTLIRFLKKNNRQPRNVLWNNKPLSIKELQEHVEAVKVYNMNGIYNGHLCSVCDSFLLLVAELYNLILVHNYNGHIIIYKHIKTDGMSLRFGSNLGHFWFSR